MSNQKCLFVNIGTTRDRQEHQEQLTRKIHNLIIQKAEIETNIRIGEEAKKAYINVESALRQAMNEYLGIEDKGGKVNEL